MQANQQEKKQLPFAGHRFTVFTVNTDIVHLFSLNTAPQTDPLRRFTVFWLDNLHS